VFDFKTALPRLGFAVKKWKLTETLIVSILKQSDASVPVKEVCQQAGISAPTYYQWKLKYGGMEASALKREKEMEAENTKLKGMCAELALDDAATRGLIETRR
jgi:putative transposase